MIANRCGSQLLDNAESFDRVVGRSRFPSLIARVSIWLAASSNPALIASPRRGSASPIHLAERLFAEAMAGDVVAIKEIGDRLDGKPAQAVVGNPGQSVELTLRWLTAAEVKALPMPGEDDVD